MKVGFEVHEDHLPLWERNDSRYAFLMGGRGNGRSGTASRYAVSRLLGKEYTRGALIRAKLHRDGFVTRNECLSQRPAITRLGARICDLQEEGWTFTTKYTGRDYVYRLVSKPKPKTLALSI